MPPPGWEALYPEDLSMGILVITVLFSAFSTAVLGLRVALRASRKAFSIEDALMCIGYVINMGHNGIICYGTFTGLGASDSRIPRGQDGPIYMEGLKVIFLWQITYLSGFVFIKVSIALTLLRIALVQWHRRLLWLLIFISVLSTVVVDIVILVQCRPIEKIWGEKEGACVPKAGTVVVTFLISGLSLFTDFATSILPILILKDLQMPPRKKIALIVVLGLGILASVATIARLPFAKSYFNNDDYMVGLGHIILWTVVECDLALIAGSLPMLQALVKGLSPGGSEPYAHPHSAELVTIGRQGYRRHENEEKEHGEGESDSARGIIVQRDVLVVDEARSIHRQEDYQSSHSAKTYL